MSMAPPELYELRLDELRTVASHGLEDIQGDPELLRDLGIPVSEEDLHSHLVSAERVEDILVRAAEIGSIVSDHDKWLLSMGVSLPASKGPIVRPAPEQMVKTSRQVQLLKDARLPLGGNPDETERYAS